MGDRLGIHDVVDILTKPAESVEKVLSEVGFEPAEPRGEYFGAKF